MKIWRRILMLARRRQFEEDLAEELRIHREMAEDAARLAGASPEIARREAGRAFGGSALALENSRAVWRFTWFESIAQDLRYALRSFARSPGFALTVIGTLSLGLGVLASAFCLFNAVVLRPYAVRDPHSLYSFSWTGRNMRYVPSTWREYDELRAAKPGFSEVLAYVQNTAAVAGSSSTVQAVSGNYFTVLGGKACLGRPIVESDAQPGARAVAVASYKTWKRRFNGDPGVIGSKVYMRAVPGTLIGVACPEFGGLGTPEYWVNAAFEETLSEGNHPLARVIGRLKPGLNETGARAALLAYALRTNTPPHFTPLAAELEPAGTGVPLRQMNAGGIILFFLVFALTLLIACANVSNMMLARALSRQREIAVRLSLGAGRWRLVRQMVTESLLLAIPSVLGAYGVAWLTISGAFSRLVRSLPVQIGGAIRLTDFSPDWRVLLFLFGCAGGAAFIIGIAPALQATRSSLVQASRGEPSADRCPARIRNVLVAVQVAICTLLLISAAVSLQSERSLAVRDDGLNTRGGFSVSAPGRLRARMVAQLKLEPSVAAVATSFGSFSMEARGDSDRVRLQCSFVTPEFFNIYGIPFLRGRNFNSDEGQSLAQLAILDETAARRLFQSGDPLGKTVAIPNPLTVRQWGQLPPFRAATVVGVVRRANFDNDVLGRGAAPHIFFPGGLGQQVPMSLLVGMRGEGQPAKRALLAALGRAAPSGADEVVSLEEVRDLRFYPVRVLSAVAGFLGALALLLTVAGIYGVLSYVVNQRRKEIGIRIALGAGAANVNAMIVRQALMLAMVSAAIGAALALAIAKVIAHWVSPVNVFDWPGYVAGIAVVIAAAMAAAYIPARRAVKVDPAITLRCD